MKLDMNKFSVAQMMSNDSGKTSGSGTCGVVVVIVGTFCFLLGTIGNMFFKTGTEIITESIVLVGIGVTLLGTRKVVDSKSTTESSTESSTESPIDGPINS